MSINTNRSTDLYRDHATEDTGENETTSLLTTVSIKADLSFLLPRKKNVFFLYSLHNFYPFSSQRNYLMIVRQFF